MSPRGFVDTDSNGTRHNYTWDGTTLVRDYYGSTILDFSYDANGQPYAMYYNSTPYFYILNLQGDVIRMVDGNGNTVASYEYDPYGRVISATGTLADINPLRYRGYYYDQETQLYHLWSRYYDPQTGRYLNHDTVFDYDVGIVGRNLFAYCGNSPIFRIDISGKDSGKIDDADLADDEIQERGGNVSVGRYSGGGLMESFRVTLSNAAKGLEMAAGSGNTLVTQKHHMLSNKNKTYTPQYKEIADRYNMSLSSKENIVEVPGHRGRHTNGYHNFMLYSIRELDIIAQGDIAIFKEGFSTIIDFLLSNTGLLYAR